MKHWLAKHWLAKHRLVKHWLVKHWLAKHWLAKHWLAKHWLAKHWRISVAAACAAYPSPQRRIGRLCSSVVVRAQRSESRARSPERLTAAAVGSAIHASAVPRRAATAWNCSPDPSSVPQFSLHSPIGDLTLSEAEGYIVAVDWGWGRDQTLTPLLARAHAQLDAYFDGEPVTFDLPLAPSGTSYRQRVWAALCRIPSGATRTYTEIAREAGGSARSVGGANAVNPIPILIPCHRVVAAGGLGGYSGGDGLGTKRALLDLETRARDRLLSRAGG